MTLLENLIDEDFSLKGRNRWRNTEDHSSLVYDAENDKFFWNSKDIKGDAYTYLLEVRGMNKEQARIFLKSSFGGFSENQETTAKSQPYEKLTELFWANGINHREYWYKRCLTDETIDRNKLGYFNGYNLIPIYENNEYVNSQMRRDEPEKKIFYYYKTGKVYLFNEGILPYAKTIYITEGLVDCLLLNQLGLPSVSAGGVNTWNQDWFSKFSKVENILYFEDNDAAGRLGSRAIANSLGLYRTKIVSFPNTKEKYDVGDFFKDGGTKESFLEHINNNSNYLFELEMNKSRKVKTWKK